MTVAEAKSKPKEAADAQPKRAPNPDDPRLDPGLNPPGAPATLHPLQKLLDHPWWLLFLGIVVPGLSYTAWGWIELLLVGPAQLP